MGKIGDGFDDDYGQEAVDKLQNVHSTLSDVSSTLEEIQSTLDDIRSIVKDRRNEINQRAEHRHSFLEVRFSPWKPSDSMRLCRSFFLWHSLAVRNMHHRPVRQKQSGNRQTENQVNSAVGIYLFQL